ncbi:HAD family hydrolase [Desulfobacter hydrogenophilus]|uniref:phosphoglycolate phosphatase n=1 Tax=Desulfobacter hydrogenophilus TaxID=2291 RepID=A0A328FGM6_9BACT|nr:HAD family hydrolase [Desulfobacter hydrogenophilus]NDY70528.1 HAD family hydrolase [Desulfobacter hydrogenophilus]QBH13902.1 HAD family hydrolase [Desulfobacter hydrogenophilus]RAM02135.1 HAD family hydrolase [Desulfobacter hydrogenophilus]
MDTAGIKAVVFDCDGVMFDTAQANRKFYNEILANFNKPSLDDEQFENIHMMTVKAAVEYLFPEMDEHRPVYEMITTIGYASVIPLMLMEPGLIELLDAIKLAGWVRGVATNRTNTMGSVLIEHKLKKSFDIIVTASDVANPKPFPDQLEKIMGAYALLPRQIVFIGDSIFDKKAAEAAGTWFIAFKQPGLKAHAHAVSMGEVGELLKLRKYNS